MPDAREGEERGDADALTAEAILELAEANVAPLAGTPAWERETAYLRREAEAPARVIDDAVEEVREESG